MKKPLTNPYLPSWEYIPDGEPYVYDGRVYVYGSHDGFNGNAYCINDYVTWSAPVDDLGNWRYEGVIYKRAEEPSNPDGDQCLYAPDMTVGPDGRYYLFYNMDHSSTIGVAVCDSPCGEFQFHGYVHYKDGQLLGMREGDQPQFDPAVLTEGEKIYLYTGFCAIGDRSRLGAMCTVLGPDMLTIEEETVFIAPSEPYSAGSGYEGHEFFEGPSIRKRGDTYYFIYSSIKMYELCYATSKEPNRGFEYKGVIVANNDMGIDSYKPIDQPMFYGGNNHGSMVQIGDDWFIFYHRHTNGTNFSRQGCVEKLQFREDGTIVQAEMTSCGSCDSLPGIGEYYGYLACNLFCDTIEYTTGAPGTWMDCRFPKITQDGRDGDENPGYIANMRDGATAGFKYFDCKGVSRISVKNRGYSKGYYEIRTCWDGPVLGTIDVEFSNLFKEYSAEIAIPDGVQALYITYRGQGAANLLSVTLA